MARALRIDGRRGFAFPCLPSNRGEARESMGCWLRGGAGTSSLQRRASPRLVRRTCDHRTSGLLDIGEHTLRPRSRLSGPVESGSRYCCRGSNLERSLKRLGIRIRAFFEGCGGVDRSAREAASTRASEASIVDYGRTNRNVFVPNYFFGSSWELLKGPDTLLRCVTLGTVALGWSQPGSLL